MPYYCPTDLSDALELVGATGGKIIAGGTDVYPSMQQGQIPDNFIDLTAIPDLSGIRTTAQEIRIGATTTWTDVICADLPSAFDGLKAAAREIGGIQIQNAGTVLGNLCNASPAADGIPPLLTLDAEVEITGPRRETRRLPLEAFVTGVRQTALQPGEIATAVIVPTPPDGAVSSFEKLGSRRYLVISIAMVAVLSTLDRDGMIRRARVAVGACSPVARRLVALENALIGADPAAVVVSPVHLSTLNPITDIRGSGEYRLDAVAEQIARAVRKVVGGD